MPSNVVHTPRDEHLWAKAKAIALAAGRKEGADDFYSYTMGVYQRMKGHTMKSEGLFLDLKKSIGLLRAGGEGQEQRWTRMPGAASMFNARDEAARETQRLMTEMPRDRLNISDGNFTSPDDVVKGLGFAPIDETIWAHRVARMVQRAPSEMALRKAVIGDLRSEALEPPLRAELGRRILSLYRQREGGKPLEKGFPPKGGFPPKKGGKAPPPAGGIGAPEPDADDKGGPPDNDADDAPAKPFQPHNPGKPGAMGARAGQDPAAAQRNPAVDAAELTELPDDKQLLQNKIHALHEDLKSCQGPITGNAALIHMHNDLKAQMRDAYRDPNPEVVADIDNKIHHFKKMLEGPPPPEVDPNDPNAQPGQPGAGGPQQPGQPGAGGFGGRGGPAKPGMMAKPGQQPPPPPGRVPGKRPMMKSYRPQAVTPAAGTHVLGNQQGKGERMKPKGQSVTSGASKSAASPTLKPEKTKKPKGAKGVPRPFDSGRPGDGAEAASLEKGATHKYIRRLPTGKVAPKYRYIYDAKKAVDTKARPKVGEKVKIAQNGQAGHYEVKRVLRDGRLDVQHDETGHRMVIHSRSLHDLMAAAHGPHDPGAVNARLDAEHRKTDLLPRSRQAVLATIKQASGIDDHDLAQHDVAYAAWKRGGRKGAKPTRGHKSGTGGELDAFESDLPKGKHFSSLLEAFEHATKGATTWREIQPAIQQLREVPGFENAHLPEDALLRHAHQDDERRNAPDSIQPKPEDYGTTVGSSVDAGGFDWKTGEQSASLATPAEAKATKRRAREAKKAPENRPSPSVPDDAGFDAFDRATQVPDDDKPEDEWGADMRYSENLVLDLSKAFDGAREPTTTGRKGEGSRGGKIIGHTPAGAPIYAKQSGAAPANPAAQSAGSDPQAEFQRLQATHAAALAQMQQAHAAMLAHAQKHGIAVPGAGAGGTQTGPTDPTRVHAPVAHGPSHQEATGVVAPQKPVEKTTTGKDTGKRDEARAAGDKHHAGPASGESPEESVPKADGLLQHGIVGHTSTGKQIRLGMNPDKLTPKEAHEASLLHREAQEHLLNAARATGNPAYKKAAKAHLEEEFSHASRGVTGQKQEDEDQVNNVFSSAKKSLAAWEALATWHPSPMWAGEDIGASFGHLLQKAMGAERQGHKYITRKPRSGGGYDYTYADTPHSKDTLKAAPLGSTLEAEHNGQTATYRKTERDTWTGAAGTALASGWFVGKPSTLTHPGGHELPTDSERVSPAAQVQHKQEGPPLVLTAAPVQQGLFSAHAYDKKPDVKPADPLVNDPRQAGLFVETPPKPTAIAEATKEAAKQPAGGPAKSAPITVEEAKRLGKEAFHAGIGAASALDPTFNARLKEHSAAFGSLGDKMIPVLKAWASGWHAANLATAPVDEPAKDEPKSAMAEATAEAEKQPAADDAANAWKVEPYDEKAEAERERAGSMRDQAKIKEAASRVEKAKEELAAARTAGNTKQIKRAENWLKTVESGPREAEESAKRMAEARVSRRAARKADVERHAGEAHARAKLAGEARSRLAAEAEKAKPKKLAETDAAKKVNRQRARETGEHVPDSAKDRSDERQLITKGDLDALSFSEAHRLVNKRNAMPVYSSDQFKARGASPGAAHLGLALANLVGPSPPEDSDKSRRAYLDGIRLVHGIMDHANTVEDYDAAVKELNEIADARFGGGKPIAVIHTARKLSEEERRAQANNPNLTWRDRQDYEGIDRPPGNYAQEVLTPRVQKENPDLAVASRYGEDGIEFYTYSKASKSAIRDSIEALGKRFNDQLMGGKGKIWSDARHQAREAEKLGVAGWDHLEKTGEAKAEAKRGEKGAREAQESGSGKETKLRWRQSISDKPAVINPTVNVTAADPARFQAAFGFRGEQPGQSIPDEELNHHRKYAEMAFHDLANVLGIPPKQVSINGRLAIAFAARGKGKAMAHYEPEKKVINITRFAGAGTIAHEWGHFMDNTVAEQNRESGLTKGRVYGSAGDHGGMPAELRNAYKAFRTALATPNPETVKKVQADYDKRFAEAKDAVTALRAHPGRLFGASPEDKAAYSAIAQAHNANLDTLTFRKKFLANPTSDYMMVSLAHDGGKEGKYWSAPEEMFARAFESYVQEKIESSGRRNSYLVDGTRETGDPMNDEAMPYPRKAELSKIHGAVGRIVDAMRNGGHFEKALKALSRRLSAREPVNLWIETSGGPHVVG